MTLDVYSDLFDDDLEALTARLNQAIAEQDAARVIPQKQLSPQEALIFQRSGGSACYLSMAETGGFEPPVEFNPDPSLAVKSVRPLRHVSMSRQRHLV